MNYSDLYGQLAGAAGWLLAVVVIVGLIALAVLILYLLTLQNTLAAVSPQNRKMAPGLVWLLLIPYVGNIFMFFVVKNISESLEAEYRMRGIPTESRPTFNIGMAYFTVGILSMLLGFIGLRMAIFGGLLGLAGLVLWIVYWVQVAQHKTRLKSTPAIPAGSSQIFQ